MSKPITYQLKTATDYVERKEKAVDKSTSEMKEFYEESQKQLQSMQDALKVQRRRQVTGVSV